MDSPRQYKEPKSNREAKRSQNYSSTPPQKDAYARLVSQHHSSKFRSYLEQYSMESASVQCERNGPGAPLRAHSERLDVPHRKRDPAHAEFSDSSDFSPSSLKTKGGAGSLLAEAHGTRSESDGKLWRGVDGGQQGDERRETTTSHGGDGESSEECGAARRGGDTQKMKYKDGARSPQAAPKSSASGGQVQEKKRPKKKSLPKGHEREGVRDEVAGSADNAAVSRPRSPHAEANKTKQPQDPNADSTVVKSTKSKTRGPKKQLFESYMSLEEVSHGLKKGDLIQGQIRINPKNFQEAFFPSPDGLWDIFLEGVVARNRALNGDVVVVRILPQEQWKVVKSDNDCDGASESDPQQGQASHSGKPGKKKKTQQRKAEQADSPNVIVEEQSSDQDELACRLRNVSLSATEGIGRTLEDPSPSNGEILQRTAKVVYITERKHSRAVTGFLKFLPDKPFAMFAPVDHRVPRINVPLDDCPPDFSLRSGDYANMLFICRITGWPEDSGFAQGRLAKSLGQAGQIEPETEGILVEYDIDFSEFSDEVLACLPQNHPWTIPAEEMRRRRDLRQECIFTIDPATARDLDDALSCKLLPDGNFEVGVHIADVSYFLEEGNALDAIASRRATSVYLVQKVIPMLPRLLCEELCSLNPLTDRLTFSVIWKMTPQGKILSEWFGRSVIRSCTKLSYDHAQSMIDAPDKLFSAEELPLTDPEHPVDEIHQAVLNLHAIAKSLRAQRFHGGALRLDQLKLSFTLDKETMMPQGCYIYQYRDSNKLVEELMLLANMAAAHRIYRSFPEQALLRRHPPPQTKMVDELQELCDQLGLSIDFSSAGALHRSLHTNLGDDQYTSARKEVLTNMCSRPMQMALYFCTGAAKDETLFKHYALNVPFYTHFTSPIRRYADVIVHRLLAAAMGCGPRLGLSGEEVHKQASRCNDKKTASKRVQELSSELFFGVFVKECGPLEAEAMVMAVLDQSFDVLVLRYGVQKRIYCKALAGVKTFHHQRVGKRGELTLDWAQDGPEEPSVQQVISIFTLVEVQLRAEGPAMKYTAVLQRPQRNAT